MYILLALVAACALGIGAHFLIGGRELRGVALTPAIATVAAGVIYTAMQWAGIGEDSIWLWLASIIGSVVIAAVATLAIVAVRRRTDAETKAALGI
ncbi:hypothetical protein [Microbacterium aurantiacum]|uniref:hypothetical protein n=1 Tax=Microbacterium aurantiacum TaxID=162393 RepID=UPI000C81064F|nr:hypothetical protein [Microbacterium aurantiacum]